MPRDLVFLKHVPASGTIIIRYKIDGGTQSHRHPSPSHPFSGTRRTAYLPATIKGRQMLRLLISAFTKVSVIYSTHVGH